MKPTESLHAVKADLKEIFQIQIYNIILQCRHLKQKMHSEAIQWTAQTHNEEFRVIMMSFIQNVLTSIKGRKLL